MEGSPLFCVLLRRETHYKTIRNSFMGGRLIANFTPLIHNIARPTYVATRRNNRHTDSYGFY